MERPDLSQTTPDIRAYIEYLETELARASKKPVSNKQATVSATPPLEPSEPPTTINLITLSKAGFIKRTPRHLYPRQRRAGMGIFDLEIQEEDTPFQLALADQNESVIVVTSLARAFRLAVDSFAEAPVRAKGIALETLLPLEPEETATILLSCQDTGQLSIVSQRGQVRQFRAHYFSEAMNPGLSLWEIRDFGSPLAACWSSGSDDLFVATQKGKAIRFAESKIPVRGCQAIRLDSEDQIVGVTAVQSDSGVFLLNAEGKGTIRLMDGFSANKAPGSGGKVAMKTDHLIDIQTIRADMDLFVISSLSKIIRFQAEEVPATPGVVQGVHCMALRADQVVALAR
ncbi:MAG: DNA gyrase C-terminal beta-propeller domain-containing protein [Chloroflexota bacterium]